jgi:hypothetical protein
MRSSEARSSRDDVGVLNRQGDGERALFCGVFGVSGNEVVMGFIRGFAIDTGQSLEAF